MQDDVPTFNTLLRSITLGEIDQTRHSEQSTLYTEAQSHSLSIIVHG
jgi:hypothetical protein